MYPRRQQGSLDSFFAGLAEQTFEGRLGVADPALIDYIAGLLARFVRSDTVFSVRDVAGRRLEEVAAMLVEARERIGNPQREVHRHIGDFTLFWTGVYPEALRRLQGPDRKDHLLDYQEQGKRAYYIASRIRDDDNAAECEVLERISHEFEMCMYGLGEVRREWERHAPYDGLAPGKLWIN